SALQHQGRLHSKEGGVPNDEIRKLSNFYRAYVIRNPLSDCGIDRIFRNVSTGSEIVVVAFFLGAPPELLLHFVGGLPSPNNHLSYAAHGLAVGRHDGKCAQVVENVLRRNRFLADAALGEG